MSNVIFKAGTRMLIQVKFGCIFMTKIHHIDSDSGEKPVDIQTIICLKVREIQTRKMGSNTENFIIWLNEPFIHICWIYLYGFIYNIIYLHIYVILSYLVHGLTIDKNYIKKKHTNCHMVLHFNNNKCSLLKKDIYVLNFCQSVYM